MFVLSIYKQFQNTITMDFIKHLLSSFPQGFATGLLLNGTLITFAYFLFWKKLKKKLTNWRIQLKQRADSQQIKAELKNAIGTLSVGALFSSIVIYASTLGYTKIYTDFDDYHLAWSLLGFFILLIIDDTWFYWMHRLLHHPRIYKYIHKEHHLSIDVNPYSSLSFHWAEALLLSFWIIPASFILPIYAPVLLVVQLWGALDNIKAHLGYELYPAWWHKSWFRFLTTSTHHNMHHSKFNGNYGVHFRFWDKVCGTEFEDYEATFDEIQMRKNTG